MAYSLTECIKIRADKNYPKVRECIRPFVCLPASGCGGPPFAVVAVATSGAQLSLGPTLLQLHLSILAFCSVTSLPVSHRMPEETLMLTQPHF